MINEAGDNPKITSGKRFQVPSSRTPVYLQVDTFGKIKTNRID